MLSSSSVLDGYQELACSYEIDDWPLSDQPSQIVKLHNDQWKEPPSHFICNPIPQIPLYHNPPRPIIPMTIPPSNLLAPKLSSTFDHPVNSLTHDTNQHPPPGSPSDSFQSQDSCKQIVKLESGYASPSSPTLTTSNQFSNQSDGTSVSFTITVCKRSNGNQPWERSNIRPPMLGKMRRITVHLGAVPTRLELLFQCKDMKQNRHEGKLVISTNDKGIARNTFATDDQTLLKTVIPQSNSSQTHVAYLKPCWRGFGNNRERPIFTVIIAVRPADEKGSFVIIHSWQVELHSHKMESSPKGKAMDARGPFEVTGMFPVLLPKSEES